jgi:uncharacterized protein (TIGR03905 family)
MIEFIPSGVCSRQMDVEVENGIITYVRVKAGCNGNLKGISTLLEGMDAKTAIDKLRGTLCKDKGTSCPDQLSYAIELALEKSRRKNGE